MLLRQIRPWLVGTMAVCALSATRANAYTLQYDGTGYGQSVSIAYGSQTYGGFAGQIKLSFTGSAGTPTGMPSAFRGYCVELEQVLQSPMDVNLNSTGLLTRNNNVPNTGPAAAWLYNTYSGGVSSNLQGAALQLAIWESLYDSSRDVNGGYFRITSSDASLLSQVNTYLSGLQNNFTSTEATWFQATNPSTSQDMIGPAAINPVPEPGALSLLASGSGGLFALFQSRRFRRKRRA